EGGTILHFDGTRWSEADKPDSDLTLLGVWAQSKVSVFVCGIADEAGLLKHYTGKTWETYPIGASGSLWEVWGSRAGPDVWMVGSDHRGRGFVLRGDGTNFDRMAFDGASLRAVWGAGPNDVWVGAYSGELYHW